MLRNRWIVAFGLTVGAVVLLGAGGAVLCRGTDLNCHLRSERKEKETKEWTLRDASGELGGNRWIHPTLEADRVVGGFDFPTDFDFLPDGRIVVASRTGLIQLVDGGKIAEQPVLDLRGTISTWGFRGLMAIAVDPSNRSPVRFYIAYSALTAKKWSPTSGKPTTVRFSRFTMRGDVADKSSEMILVGRVSGRSCLRQPTADCITADRGHIGADIAFWRDGTLLLATGDGGPAVGNVKLAQNLDSLNSKILRVDRNGYGVPGNPFWNGDRTSNRSRVWAYGLRNPFRIALMPDGQLVVGDVGYNRVEELNVIQPGQDYGWPCFEGSLKTPEYRMTRFCEIYYRKYTGRAMPAWFALPHKRWASITAGTSLASATKIPYSMRNKYMFGDWLASNLWVADPPRTGRLLPPSRLRVVERGAAGPVRIRVGPDGAVYVLKINVGELWRIIARNP